MSKIRLIALLFTLTLAALAMFAVPPAAQADWCSIYNSPGCTYFWNPTYGCCVAFGFSCPWYCA